MNINAYNAFCKTLSHATHVVQWGGTDVWKIGGKVFAMARWNDEADELFATFKCSPMSYDMLKEMPGCRPAPYLASRGMKWIQRTGPETLNDGALQDYIRESYRLVALGLPKKVQKELGLL
ncbi:MAG: MmcQ/YjbR family DNA-binding protein [Filomicrobium sp.]